MSTPSTATATLPPHHQYYSHHQNYQPVVGGYGQLVNGSSRLGNPHNYANNYAASNSSSDLRRTVAVNSHQSEQMPPKDVSQTSDTQQSAKRDRAPTNWNKFYEHGVPKEIIVIDESPEPAQTIKEPEPQSTMPTTNGSTRHADKKRKTAASAAYDPVYHQQTSYSTTQTPYYDSPSYSTERTASAVNGTAATSLGSQASNGAYAPPLEEGVVGQKRKRTRKATLDEEKEAKRRELEKQSDPYQAYIPPPNPPIKAREVYVQVVADKSYMKNEKVDDDDGHYVVVPEADLTDRYQILKLLGQGTFGKVVEAFDRKKGSRCAIKVIRSVQKYRDASRIELRVLSTLASNDRSNRNKCIHLRDCFDFRNHICIVTDLYGQSVFDFLKSNQFVPFPSTHIQTFARQLFTSVAFLHDLSLIHTDLKPENILLVNNAYQTFTYNRTIPSSSTTTSRSAKHRKVLLDPEIRLIDFGSATFQDEYHSSVVSTRHYRAPEIILNLGWSYPCDIWSIGCILVEFFTGDALFQTHDNLEHLAMMEPVCGGKLDKELIRRVHKPEKGQNRNPATAYFRSSGRTLDYPNAETQKASKKYVKAMKKLHEIIPSHTEFNRQFLDLLKRIFVYDPDKRITAKQALKHPWFRELLKDDGTEATKIRLDKEKKEKERSEAKASARSNGYR
ncbi:CMGC/CLK protein kinase [Coniosporium apollinis CBS 100218]|uniref:dual-specificity kinase n=1 Tax=Coniosporium apollinis (strain CBS 100218) TaxID=1168221 RepID=R7YJZ3_CONA1|nr:CMGC/CLK protein kinase [Coniosporium apollinis CBS 100218]EON62220.1 CMGC/CLK protein kinase [Coniosporium apollinis CBS 100218]